MPKHNFNVTCQRSGKTVKLVLSGYIYPGAERTSSAAVCDKLNEVEEGDELEVHIRNLYGGSVPEGLTIFHDLVALKPVIKIDGVAASMGAIIPLAGKRIEMSRHSKMMLHRVSAGAYGDPDQMEEQVKQAREWETELCDILAERTGLTVDEVREKYMTTGKDVWLTADQAKTAKLVDEVVKGSLLRTVPDKDLEKAKDAEDILERFAACHTPEQKPQPTGLMKFFGKKTSAIEALKDVAVGAVTAEQITAATTELQTEGVNAFLVPCTADVQNVAQLEASIAKLDKRATTAEAALVTANAEVTRLKAIVPANTQVDTPVSEKEEQPKSENEQTPEAKAKKDLQAKVDALPHNKAMREHFEEV